MGVDQPEEGDVPPDGHGEHRDGQNDGGRTGRAAGTPPETRSREEYYAELSVKVAEERSATRHPTAAREQAAAEKWGETVEQGRWMWGEYQRRWPAEERAPVDRSQDPPGSWRGEGNRFLDTAANGRVDAECDVLGEREREKISPALRAVESQDPERHLVGFEHRLKGSERIKEKVCQTIKESNRSPEQAVSLVPDAIRYTFQYREAHYTQGVLADITHLKDQGFKLDKLKNSWADDQYKGINSQWIDPNSGQRFEVQFHTRISFEAKQLTHTAYERLRTRQADIFEELVLEAFQKKITTEVPVPPGTDGIFDYPERGPGAR